MSSSVFKDYPSSSSALLATSNNSITTTTTTTEDDIGGLAKCDKNLVVFINKNGNVSMDQTALQDLLGKF